ncbi:MAG: hypothetical protein KF914_01395 [Rhizobiaceae bacterium]|nr:hypothetical protein [Rhizobiaceae bacterium]
MRIRLAAALLLGAALVGCTTTEDADNAIKSRWLGQPSDSFFAQYGPPVRSFPMTSGGTIYTWQGGSTTRDVPAQYRDMTDAEKEAAKGAPQTIINITTNGSIAQTPPPGKVLVSPAKTVQLSCEAQITADTAGIITDIKATRDTDGEGLSFSRCAEVFGVTR